MYGEVRSTQRLTPSMVRVVLGGGDLDEFVPTPYSDQYINAQFIPAGAPYTAPFDPDDLEAVAAEYHPEPAATQCAGGTATSGSSPSTSSPTATTATQAPGRSKPSRVTASNSRGRAAHTILTPMRRGTSWRATKARCPLLAHRWRHSHRVPARWCWW